MTITNNSACHSGSKPPTLTLGEINYRIFLTVNEINKLVDFELSLKDLKADLKRLRKVRRCYTQVLNKYKEDACAIRSYYVELINELNATSGFQTHSGTRKRQRRRRLGDSLLSESEQTQSLLIEPVIPEVRLPTKSRLYKMIRAWRRKYLHVSADSHSLVSHGMEHLAQLNNMLVAKRQRSPEVQQGILATKKSIKAEMEAINELRAVLKSPPRYIFEDKYKEYCKAKLAKLVQGDADNGSGNKKLKLHDMTDPSLFDSPSSKPQKHSTERPVLTF